MTFLWFGALIFFPSVFQPILSMCDVFWLAGMTCAQKNPRAKLIFTPFHKYCVVASSAILLCIVLRRSFFDPNIIGHVPKLLECIPVRLQVIFMSISSNELSSQAASCLLLSGKLACSLVHE